jgi:hypothetical protein
VSDQRERGKAAQEPVVDDANGRLAHSAELGKLAPPLARSQQQTR